MGLQKEITFDNGMTLNDGYSVIYKLEQNIFPIESIEIIIRIYYNKQMFDDNRPAVDEMTYNVQGNDYDLFFSDFELNKSDQTLVTQAYSYLKSLSVYNGAIEI